MHKGRACRGAIVGSRHNAICVTSAIGQMTLIFVSLYLIEQLDGFTYGLRFVRSVFM